jgi:hypothetical protein
MSEPIGPAVARERLRGPLRELRESLGLSSDREDRDRDWWTGYRFTPEYPTYIAREAQAARINVCQPLVVPGILQTTAYAKAATSAIIGLAPDDPAVLARLEVRLGRQFDLLDRMTRPDPPRLTVILDETVLSRPVGGAEALRGQLDQLIELGGLDPITLVVMPTRAGAHPGLGGVFELLEFAGGPDQDVVFLESSASDSLLTERAGTAPYHDSLARLVAAGQNGAAAIETITAIRDSLG